MLGTDCEGQGKQAVGLRGQETRARKAVWSGVTESGKSSTAEVTRTVAVRMECHTGTQQTQVRPSLSSSGPSCFRREGFRGWGPPDHWQAVLGFLVWSTAVQSLGSQD